MVLGLTDGIRLSSPPTFLFYLGLGLIFCRRLCPQRYRPYAAIAFYTGLPVYVFWWAILNFSHAPVGISIFSAGILLNVVVVLANRGKMPVASGIFREEDQHRGIYTRMDQNTKLNFLGDRITWLGGASSIGDLNILAGFYILVAELLLR